MQELIDIEELLKSEDLAKSVDRKGLKLLFHHNKTYHDPNSSPEAKQEALNHIKAIVSGQKILSKPKKQPKADPAISPKTVEQAKLQPAAPKLEMPEGLHLTALNTGGHSEDQMKNIFNALPDSHKQDIIKLHNESKMKKSMERIYSLLEELKKQIQ